jgi:hypothetical protein
MYSVRNIYVCSSHKNVCPFSIIWRDNIESTATGYMMLQILLLQFQVMMTNTDTGWVSNIIIDDKRNENKV